MTPRITKVISGGQTGADRGALDAAIELGIAHGGWCPRGRKAEDGVIPARYVLAETISACYPDRTERNVRDSDATLVFTHGKPTGGSAKTLKYARQSGKPVMHIDLTDPQDARIVRTIAAWLSSLKNLVLNVAGSRESRAPGIQARVHRLMTKLLLLLGNPKRTKQKKQARKKEMP